MFNRNSNPRKYAAAAVVAVALAFGAYAVGNSSSGNGSNGTANAAQAQRNGQPPRGFGTPVTGTAAAQVKAAVLAKYKGTVDRIIKLPDGSYLARVTTSNGDLRVAVSKDYQVTGAQQGGPGAGGPRGGATPPGNGGQPLPGNSS